MTRSAAHPPERKHASLPAALVGGGITGMVTLAYSLSFATLMFSGDLAQGLPVGVASAFIGAGAIALAAALTGSSPTAISGPDAPSVAVLVTLFAGLPLSGAALTAHALATVTASTLVTGVGLYLLGHFRVGNWIRYIPYPVIGGFVAATGWFLIIGGVKVATGETPHLNNLVTFLDPDNGPKLLAALAFSGMLLFSSRLRWTQAMPLLLLLGTAAIHAWFQFRGYPVAQAQQDGWLLGSVSGLSLLAPLQTLREAQLDWGLVFGQAAEWGVVLMVTVITLLLNATGLEAAGGGRGDLDRELKSNGIANLVSAGGGGLVGNLSLSRTLLNRKLGATGRASGVIAGGVCFAALLWGETAIGYVPRTVLAGILLMIGFGILSQWLFKIRARLSLMDYALVVGILTIIVLWGYLQGVLLGVIVACLTFAANYSRIPAIKQELTWREYPSNVERSEIERGILKRASDHARVFRLQGYVFFGSANRIYERISTHCGELRYIVLDFQLVTGLDSSAVYSFQQLRELAHERHWHLIFCDLNDKDRAALHSMHLLGEASDQTTREFNDLDAALEWIEQQILREQELGALAHEFQLRQALGNRIFQFTRRLELQAGEVLFEQGEAADSMYFISDGQIDVQLCLGEKQEPIRLRSMYGGTVLGEMGLYRQSTRTARAVAVQPTQLHELTRKDLLRMREEDPDLGTKVDGLIIRLLADRLSFANGVIAALRR